MLYFIVVMTFLHDSAGDCGTTFYKAAGLINGQKITFNKLMVSVANRVD